MDAAELLSPRARILASLLLFSSFYFLGVFISALGPALPALARAVAQPESLMGLCIASRGIGYLSGSAMSSVSPARCGLAGVANRTLILAATTLGMAICSGLVAETTSFEALVVYSSLQGLCGGAIDAIANFLIGEVHGEKVAPWMQALHFLFSVGALSSPAAVGAFGYRRALLGFSGAAIPCAVAAAAWSTSADAWLIEQSATDHAENVQSPRKAAGNGGTSEHLPAEDVGGFVGGGGSFVRGDGEYELRHRHLSEESPGRFAERGLELVPRAQGVRFATGEAAPDDDGESGEPETFTPRRSGLGLGVQPSEREPPEVAEAAEGALDDLSGFVDEREAAASAGRAPMPLAMLLCLMTFFLLYVGTEVGYAAWISLAAIEDGLADESHAAYLGSAFWGAVAVGRLLSVPLSVWFSPLTLLASGICGVFVSSLLLVVLGRGSLPALWVCTLLFGLAMAGLYPLAMSLPAQLNAVMSPGATSSVVIAGACGEMFLPLCIGFLLDATSPEGLYVGCACTTVLMAAAVAGCVATAPKSANGYNRAASSGSRRAVLATGTYSSVATLAGD